MRIVSHHALMNSTAEAARRRCAGRKQRRSIRESLAVESMRTTAQAPESVTTRAEPLVTQRAEKSSTKLSENLRLSRCLFDTGEISSEPETVQPTISA